LTLGSSNPDHRLSCNLAPINSVSSLFWAW
jgi:hypothetical protein